MQIYKYTVAEVTPEQALKFDTPDAAVSLTIACLAQGELVESVSDSGTRFYHIVDKLDSNITYCIEATNAELDLLKGQNGN